MRGEPGSDDLALWRELASRPRPAGHASETQARARCRQVLEGLGFSTTELPFEYSAFPGRWATPLGGVIAFAAIAGGCHLGAHGSPAAALVLLVVALGMLVVGGRWLARSGVLTFPVDRRVGVNIEARRASGVAPRVWLVAHLDTKSQPVSTAFRAAGIVLTSSAWAAAIILAILALAGWSSWDAWVACTIAAAVGSLPVMASVVGSHSAGALDNASGVASVIGAARRLPADAPVGILLTTAEELGLAGARAWVKHHPGARVPVINCDGVDDDGRIVLMYSGRRPTRVIGAAQRTARELGIEVRPLPLIPGLLVDAVAFADDGWESITVSRGTWGTLDRVHRPSDDLNHMQGRGIEEASRLLASTATLLATE